MLSSALVGIQGDTERRDIVRGGLEKWVAENPPPPGVEMRGPYPLYRYRPPSEKKKKDEPIPPEERARQRWMTQWNAVNSALYDQAEAKRLAQGYTDWRPVLSYGNNLDRIGDLLLDTDGAWELLGRTIERPRRLVEPMVKGGGASIPTTPVNDRRLAEQRVWQYPWYWSAGTLAGMWLLSVFVLSRRIKSLDRLK